MRKYFTGLVLMKGESRLGATWRGSGWKALVSPSRAEVRKHFCRHPSEIVIQAANCNAAHKALSLIQTAHNLLSGGPGILGNSAKIVPADPTEYKDVYRDPPFDHPFTINTAGFPQACRLAAAASRRRDHTYALALYQVSLSIHSNHPMDLEHYLPPGEHRSPIPYDHARFAYAIVTAYAVLEQLGLGINGQAFDNGKWIPEKKADLEQRLTKAGFDLGHTVLWELRGGRTRLETRRKTRPGIKADWAWGRLRDEEVAIVDAIADVRSLRSGIAAHDVKDLAFLLSIHDVSNAQHLARLGILTCLHFEGK